MVSGQDKIRLMEALLRMFNAAQADAVRAVQRLTPEKDEDDSGGSTDDAQKETLALLKQDLGGVPAADPVPLIPQACAFLLSTGHIIGGIAPNPVSYDNPEAEDAIQVACEAIENSPILRGVFEVVAIAMTTTTNEDGEPSELDLGLYEQSLSEIPHFKADGLLLVDTVTRRMIASSIFQDYRMAS